MCAVCKYEIQLAFESIFLSDPTPLLYEIRNFKINIHRALSTFRPKFPKHHVKLATL